MSTTNFRMEEKARGPLKWQVTEQGVTLSDFFPDEWKCSLKILHFSRNSFQSITPNWWEEITQIEAKQTKVFVRAQVCTEIVQTYLNH